MKTKYKIIIECEIDLSEYCEEFDLEKDNFDSSFHDALRESLEDMPGVEVSNLQIIENDSSTTEAV